MINNCCDVRTAAVALARWALGVLFLIAGIGKLPNVAAFVQYLSGQFEKTWLPNWLILPYGYVLPYVEVALGVLLILGVARNIVLFATGLLLITLMLGQMLLREPTVVFSNFVYTVVAAVLLFCEQYDRWTLPPPRPRA